MLRPRCGGLARFRRLCAPLGLEQADVEVGWWRPDPAVFQHALRARVVPTPEATNTRPALDKQLLDLAPHRLSWMRLLARVFRIDVSVCQRCQGPIRVLRAVTSPDEVAAALHAARPAPRPSPRGQLMLFLA